MGAEAPAQVQHPISHGGEGLHLGERLGLRLISHHHREGCPPLAAFSGSLYWGIASQRQEDQRNELRQLAGSANAAAQLPLIAHETREAESSAKVRAGSRRVATPALQQQRLQWFDAKGALLREQGNLAVPPLPEVPRRTKAEARGNSVSNRPLWQR